MIDGLTFDQMRVFVAVADAGSFRAGAGRLLRAQSAVSHAIARMEAELGVALFDRGGHRPVLTDEGRALLADARDILLRVDAMRARAQGMGEGVELELSLVVDTLFPIAAVAEALNAMRAGYPTVAIRLAVEPLGGPLAGLLERRHGLGITVGEHFRSPQIAMEALCTVDVVAVASPAHPLAGAGRPLGAAELAGHLQIVLSDPSTMTVGRDFGVLSPQTCRVSTQDTKHQLILAGVGWGRLPAWQVERDLAEGRLARLDTPSLGRDSQAASEAYLAHRMDAPPGPAARAFCRALAGLVRG
ncbi:LysR family transcriptional regulator [Pigmentiphaga sp. NML080357]|uniref:LysR family transcriptional regulator n=1 Tax=Pigmentiphaga sp. NML080357 TaxID=2008675 RepID=UPI000B40D43A|nr:LysR family transcriptional regulator [Pigmentiphaga sp. NML080357]OVZ64793.1 LysR family transcriptional regulator [Pigmentiphaga sp. NML080357]